MKNMKRAITVLVAVLSFLTTALSMREVLSMRDALQQK